MSLMSLYMLFVFLLQTYTPVLLFDKLHLQLKLYIHIERDAVLILKS